MESMRLSNTERSNLVGMSTDDFEANPSIKAQVLEEPSACEKATEQG